MQKQMHKAAAHVDEWRATDGYALHGPGATTDERMYGLSGYFTACLSGIPAERNAAAPA